MKLTNEELTLLDEKFNAYLETAFTREFKPLDRQAVNDDVKYQWRQNIITFYADKKQRYEDRNFFVKRVNPWNLAEKLAEPISADIIWDARPKYDILQGYAAVQLTEHETEQLRVKFNEFLTLKQITMEADVESAWFLNLKTYMESLKQGYCESKGMPSAIWKDFGLRLDELNKHDYNFIRGMCPPSVQAKEIAERKQEIANKKQEIGAKITELKGQQIVLKAELEKSNLLDQSDELGVKYFFAKAQLEKVQKEYLLVKEGIEQNEQIETVLTDYEAYLTALQIYLAEKRDLPKPEGYEDYVFSKICFLTANPTQSDRSFAPVSKARANLDPEKKTMEFRSVLQESLWDKLAFLQKNIIKLDEITEEVQLVTDLFRDKKVYSKYKAKKVAEEQKERMTGTNTLTNADAGNAEQGRFALQVDQSRLKRLHAKKITPKLVEVKDESSFDSNHLMPIQDELLLEELDPETERLGAEAEKTWFTNEEKPTQYNKEKTAQYNNVLNRHIAKKRQSDESRLKLRTDSGREVDVLAVPSNLFQYATDYKIPLLVFHAYLKDEKYKIERANIIGNMAPIDYRKQIDEEIEKLEHNVSKDPVARDQREQAAIHEAVGQEKQEEVCEILTQSSIKSIEKLNELKSELAKVTKQDQIEKLSKKMFGRDTWGWRDNIELGIEHPTVEMVQILNKLRKTVEDLQNVPTTTDQTVLLGKYFGFFTNIKLWLETYLEVNGIKNNKESMNLLKEVKEFLGKILESMDPNASKKKNVMLPIAIITSTLDWVTKLTKYSASQQEIATDLNDKNQDVIIGYLKINDTITDILKVLEDGSWVDDYIKCPYYGLLKLRVSVDKLRQQVKKQKISELDSASKNLKLEIIDNALKEIERVNGWEPTKVAELERAHEGLIGQSAKRHSTLKDVMAGKTRAQVSESQASSIRARAVTWKKQNHKSVILSSSSSASHHADGGVSSSSSSESGSNRNSVAPSSSEETSNRSAHVIPPQIPRSPAFLADQGASLQAPKPIPFLANTSLFAVIAAALNAYPESQGWTKENVYDKFVGVCDSDAMQVHLTVIEQDGETYATAIIALANALEICIQIADANTESPAYVGYGDDTCFSIYLSRYKAESGQIIYEELQEEQFQLEDIEGLDQRLQSFSALPVGHREHEDLAASSSPS